MPLTLPALFVYIEVKDYIPAAFAGAGVFILWLYKRGEKYLLLQLNVNVFKSGSQGRE